MSLQGLARKGPLTQSGSVSRGGGYPHPFRARLHVADAAAPILRIAPRSYLLRLINMGGTNSVPISNLDTDIALTSVLKVWLSVSVSGAVAQTGAIAWGGAWPGAGLIVGSGLSQTQFNIPIGKVTTPADNVSGFRFFIGSTAYMFEQYVFSNLLCEVRCAGGAPALYAFPFAGGVA